MNWEVGGRPTSKDFVLASVHGAELPVSSQPRFITASGKSVAISLSTAAMILAEAPAGSSSIWLPQHLSPALASEVQKPPLCLKPQIGHNVGFQAPIITRSASARSR